MTKNRITKALKASPVNKFYLIILVLLLLTDLVILFEIPIFRQVLGFTFLYVVPGVMLLGIMGLNKLGMTDRFVLSTGLSISFLIFVSIFINTLYPFFGYDTPLSRNSLIISLSVILIIAVLAYLRDKRFSHTELFDFKLNTREKAFLLIPSIFPMLSVLGMHLMNTTDNNILLMALLFIMPAYAIFIAVSHNHVPKRAYPLIIFLSSISLVLLLGLRSNHIIGADAHSEYYLFQQTFHNGRWQILQNNTLDSCLSVSALPTVYQSFVDMNPEYLFKILYPVLFSASPLVIYIISRKYIGNFYAFLASLFFMSQITFLWTTANPRTTVAIFFFALSIMVLFQSGLNQLEKRVLFIIFAVSCIVSHYSTTYIFFILLSLLWLFMKITHMIISSKKSPGPLKNLSSTSPGSKAADLGDIRHLLKSNMTIGIIVLFFVILFLWYSQVTGAAFNSGVGFIAHSLRSLQDFFILEARSEDVAGAFGIGLGEKGVPKKITFIFYWLTIVFIAIGVLSTLIRYRQRVALVDDKEHHSSFLSQRLDAEFFILSLICSAIMVAAVALPFASKGYGIDRAYLQMMVVLSSFFVIGGITVAESLHFRRRYLMVLVVLIPFFMCNTGTMYQVFGNPSAMTLNSIGIGYDRYYISDGESNSAKWLGENIEPEKQIYNDYSSSNRLLTQGGIPYKSSSHIVAFLEKNQKLDGYIYLRRYNIANGNFLIRPAISQEIGEYWQRLSTENKIYANGDSEIWR